MMCCKFKLKQGHQGFVFFRAINSLKIWCEQHASKITRIDLAHDDMTGEVLSIDKSLKWLQDGLFSNNGAREGTTAVKGRLIDDLGSGDGKTLYIGNRPQHSFYLPGLADQAGV